MKRSKMVLKIAEILVEPRHEEIMDQASYLLKKLEQYGMRFTTEDRYRDEKLLKVTEWENEDNGI